MVCGVKMFVISGIMVNEVFCSCIQLLCEGDEMYVLLFVVLMNVKGMKIMLCKLYEEYVMLVFDNLLLSCFDENDVVLYFDDVKVLWEWIFVVGNIVMCVKQFYVIFVYVYQNY